VTDQSIPLVDLSAINENILEEISTSVASVLKEGRFINGPEVGEFERELASAVGGEEAVGCNSGTDALYLALRACGVGEGDEVITSSFTFVATAEAIARCGARPVFVDINPTTYNLDPEHIEDAITGSTRAILPVHLFGHPAEMAQINDIARRHGLRVIEDAAQSLGATYGDAPVGAIGDVGCFSFFPSKVIGAAGDAGAIVTNDTELASAARRVRNHGQSRSYFYEEHGLNSRLDTIQAAVLLVKLRNLNNFIDMRREAASLYAKSLDGLPVKIPGEVGDVRHAFGYYTIEVEDRDGLKATLGEKGISTAVYYPLGLHSQPTFADAKAGDMSATEAAQGRVLSLPMYPGLTSGQIERVTSAIRSHLE
jgi:dTDP-4-amino-4,6-dideoxygalactose transaminase